MDFHIFFCVRNSLSRFLDTLCITFDVSIVRHCGPDLKVDVINVKEQADQQMSLFEFGEYFKHKSSVEEVFNLISLEFSDTQLIHLVKPPKIVRELSWVSTASHDELKEQLLDNVDLANTEFYPFGQPQAGVFFIALKPRILISIRC